MIDKGIKYEDRTGFFLGGGGYDIGGGGNPANAPSSKSSPSNNNSGNSGSDNNHSRFDVGSGYYGETVTNTPQDTKEQYAVSSTTTPKGEEVKVPSTSLEVKRNTGLEKARLANIALAEDLKNTKYGDVQTKIPAFIPYSGLINTGLNILGGFGFKKNKDFFQENVAGKYGYGYGYEDFEQYMEDRLSGKVGAYGNENMGQNAINERSGGDNRQDVSGILEALIQPVEEPEVLPKGFTYTPYSNQVVIAPGSEGLASLTGGQGFLQNII